MRNHAAGVVTDCLNTAVYPVPAEGSGRIATITALTKVTVDMDESTDDFYKVLAPDGIQGYCMRKFIAVHR